MTTDDTSEKRGLSDARSSDEGPHSEKERDVGKSGAGVLDIRPALARESVPLRRRKLTRSESCI